MHTAACVFLWHACTRHQQSHHNTYYSAAGDLAQHSSMLAQQHASSQDNLNSVQCMLSPTMISAGVLAVVCLQLCVPRASLGMTSGSEHVIGTSQVLTCHMAHCHAATCCVPAGHRVQHCPSQVCQACGYKGHSSRRCQAHRNCTLVRNARAQTPANQQAWLSLCFTYCIPMCCYSIFMYETTHSWVRFK